MHGFAVAMKEEVAIASGHIGVYESCAGLVHMLGYAWLMSMMPMAMADAQGWSKQLSL
jgi:hypothetical protein